MDSFETSNPNHRQVPIYSFQILYCLMRIFYLFQTTYKVREYACNRSKLSWNQISGCAFLSTLLPENYLHPWCSLMLCPLRSRGSGVTVAVLLSWEPPREGDLPVRNYRVTWTDRNTHTTHKHTHTFHAQTRNNMHTLPTHSRPVEQGKKENNARVTQGVRNHFNIVFIIY